MQAFSPKGAAEVVDVSVDFSQLMLPTATISSCSVTADVYQYSPITDASPSNLLSGTAQVNSADYVTADGNTLPAKKGVIQRLKAGLVTCIYVLTFTAVTSDGETLVEQVTIVVVAYVPQ